MNYTLNEPLPFGIGEAGAAFDVRVGANPEDWFFDGVYAWPVPPKLSGEPNPSPVTLQPAMLHPSWPNVSTGIFRRYQVSHFTQLGTVPWEQFERQGEGDWVLQPKASGLGALQSIEPTPAGAIIGIHLYAYGPPISSGEPATDGSDTSGLALTVQFGGTSAADRFTLNVFENGYGKLSKGGDFTAWGGFGTSAVQHLAEGPIVPLRWQTILGAWLKIFIVPHGRNKLLVTSSAGNGFVWQDPAIKQDEPPAGSTTPKAVTKAAPAVFGLYRKGAFQPYPSVKYPTSGTATPKNPNLYSFPYSPAGGEAVARVIDTKDTPGTTACSTAVHFQATHADGPNTTHTSVVPTVSMTRGAQDNQTPIHYRASVTIPPTSVSRPGNPTAVPPDLIELQHTETKDGFTGSLKLRFAQKYPAYRNLTNTPFLIGSNGNEYVKSLLYAPTYARDGNYESLQWGLQGLMRCLENVQLGSIGRLDRYALADAVKRILTVSGFPSDGSQWDVDDSAAYVLTAGEIDQRALNIPDIIRSAADWLRYLRDTYTSSPVYPFQWVLGFRPYLNPSSRKFEYRFYFKDPGKFSTLPDKRYYPTHDLAVQMGGALYRTAYLSTQQRLQEQYVEAESNWVQVYGLTLDDKVLTSLKKDLASIRPDTPIGSRPSNWLGEYRQFILIDSSFVTQADVNAACAKLFARLSKAQMQINWEGQWEPTLRMWDLARLNYSPDPRDYDGSGNDVGRYNGLTHYQDYRISAMATTHHQDSGNQPIRTTQFTGMRFLP